MEHQPASRFFFVPHPELPKPEELREVYDDPETTCFIYPFDCACQVENIFADYTFHFTTSG